MSAYESASRMRERAERWMPGGVSSPVRAFGAVGGDALVVASASGSRVRDVDGRELLDFVGSWGPLILGHAHPEVVDALAAAAARGTSYGATCAVEIELAELICSLVPGLEQVRFVSSGTEAAMSALRLARGFTGRDLVVKFSGCYHGHADHLLVAAGSGLATFSTPSSGGVPEAFAALTRVLPLDDPEAVEELFRRDGEHIAAVIIEPVPANNGLLVQRPEFLAMLRRATAEHGALLVFDEVISGFRLGPGGAAERYGVVPDLFAFGKVIGGGLPVGAFGGRAEIMARLAPLSDVYQAGTLSGNPLAMTSGLKTLEILQRDDGWQRLEQLGVELEGKLEPVLRDAPVPAQLVRVGSVFWIPLQEGPPPTRAEAIDARVAELYRPLFRALLDAGIFVAPSAYEVAFLSLAHDEEDLDLLAGALDEGLAAVAGEAP